VDAPELSIRGGNYYVGPLDIPVTAEDPELSFEGTNSGNWCVTLTYGSATSRESQSYSAAVGPSVGRCPPLDYVRPEDFVEDGSDAPPRIDHTNLWKAEVGECTGTMSGLPYWYNLFDCSGPHYGEVYATGALDVTGEYPGRESTQRQVSDICLPAFEAYVGARAGTSETDAAFHAPDKEAWEDGDGTYLCYIQSEGVAMEGSVKGAAR